MVKLCFLHMCKGVGVGLELNSHPGKYNVNGSTATAKRDIPVLVIHRGQCNLYVGNGKENI